MSYTLQYKPEVAGDLKEITAWLRSESPGLDQRFAAAFRIAVSRIGEQLELYAADEDGLRKVLLRPFKYHIGYIVHDLVVKVVGVYHAHRHPETWTTRTKDEKN